MPTLPTETNVSSRADQTWLIYDGECGFCRACVAWLQQRDRAGRLRPVPFQDAPNPPLTPQLLARARHSVVTIGPDDRVRFAGRAILASLAEIGWMPVVVRIAALPPLVWLIELGYRIVAGNRSRLSRVLFRERCAACGD